MNKKVLILLTTSALVMGSQQPLKAFSWGDLSPSHWGSDIKSIATDMGNAIKTVATDTANTVASTAVAFGDAVKTTATDTFKDPSKLLGDIADDTKVATEVVNTAVNTTIATATAPLVAVTTDIPIANTLVSNTVQGTEDIADAQAAHVGLDELHTIATVGNDIVTGKGIGTIANDSLSGAQTVISQASGNTVQKAMVDATTKMATSDTEAIVPGTAGKVIGGALGGGVKVAGTVALTDIPSLYANQANMGLGGIKDLVNNPDEVVTEAKAIGTAEAAPVHVAKDIATGKSAGQVARDTGAIVTDYVAAIPQATTVANSEIDAIKTAATGPSVMRDSAQELIAGTKDVFSGNIKGFGKGVGEIAESEGDFLTAGFVSATKDSITSGSLDPIKQHGMDIGTEAQNIMGLPQPVINAILSKTAVQQEQNQVIGDAVSTAITAYTGVGGSLGATPKPIATAIAPNGLYVATGLDNSTLMMLKSSVNVLKIKPGDPKPTMAPVGTTVTLDGAPATAASITWSPDSAFFAVVSADPVALEVYSFDGTNAPTKVEASLTWGLHGPSAVAWHPKGGYIAVGNAGNNSIQLFGFSTTEGVSMVKPLGTSVFTRTGASGLGILAWSPDGNYCAVVDQVHAILQAYAFSAGKLTLVGGDAGAGHDAHAIFWTPDDKYITIATSANPPATKTFYFNGKTTPVAVGAKKTVAGTTSAVPKVATGITPTPATTSTRPAVVVSQPAPHLTGAVVPVHVQAPVPQTQTVHPVPAVVPNKNAMGKKTEPAHVIAKRATAGVVHKKAQPVAKVSNKQIVVKKVGKKQPIVPASKKPVFQQIKQATPTAGKQARQSQRIGAVEGKKPAVIKKSVQPTVEIEHEA